MGFPPDSYMSSCRITHQSCMKFSCPLFLPSPFGCICRHQSVEFSLLFKERNHIISEDIVAKSRKKKPSFSVDCFLKLKTQLKRIILFFAFHYYSIAFRQWRRLKKGKQKFLLHRESFFL